MQANFKFSFLSSNAIKILAAFFMAIDHIGLVLFPQIQLLRILGRISMPLFAFMIAEGAHYTKNKLKYFSLIFLLGACCQVVFYIVEKSFYMGILITFSTSILMIYALQFFKAKLFNGKLIEKVYSFLIFAISVLATFFLNKFAKVDYGFWGCMLPVFASIFRLNHLNSKLKCFDFIPINLLTFAIGLVILCFSYGGMQYYALLSLIILSLYSGKRGKLKLKYFFYLFYPTHSVIIYGINMLIK